MGLGPKLTKEQSVLYTNWLNKRKSIGYMPPLAWRLLAAFNIKNGISPYWTRTKEHVFGITGGPRNTLKELKYHLKFYTRWGNRILRIVPPKQNEGWRAIIEKIQPDPACWI